MMVNGRLFIDEHRLINDKVNVVKIIGVQTKFSLYSNEIIYLKFSRVFGKVDLCYRFRSAPSAEEALAHGVFGNNDIITVFRGKGHIETFNGQLFAYHGF